MSYASTDKNRYSAAPSRTDQISALTGIRFFAAAYVFIFHYGASAAGKAEAPGLLTRFLDNGYVGVSMFFILSGFILSHAHARRMVSYRHSKRFFLSRFARIYPVYVFALLISLPITWERLDLQKTILALSLTQAWSWSLSGQGFTWISPAWTLSVEAAFYLSFPLLFGLVRNCSTKLLFTILALDVLFMIYAGVAAIHPGYTALDFFSDRLWLAYVPIPLLMGTEFFYGMALYAMLQKVKFIPIHALGNGVTTVIAMATVVSLAISSSPHVVTASAVIFGVLLCALHETDNVLKRVLGTKILFVLGASSYALYITQVAFHHYCLAFLPHGKLFALPVCIILSIGVWFFIEEPARRKIMGPKKPVERNVMEPSTVMSQAPER